MQRYRIEALYTFAAREAFVGSAANISPLIIASLPTPNQRHRLSEKDTGTASEGKETQRGKGAQPGQHKRETHTARETHSKRDTARERIKE